MISVGAQLKIFRCPEGSIHMDMKRQRTGNWYNYQCVLKCTSPCPDLFGRGLMHMKIFNTKIVFHYDVEDQVNEYLAFKEKRFPTMINFERGQLHSLIHFTKIKDVCELTKAQVFEWYKTLYPRQSYYYYTYCVKTVRCLLRYHRARGMACLDPYELHDRDLK